MKFLILILSLFLPLTGLSAEEKDPSVDGKMMAAWKAYATPGEMHKVLATMAGNWTYTSKMWQTEDGKPEESKGTSSMKMIMGGRFLQQNFKGKAMGQNFEGMGFTGYDNLKRRFDTVWLDSMGTGMMIGRGTYDKDTKIIKDKGEYTDPMKDENEGEYRGEWKFIDKNNMVYTMFSEGPDGGKEFRQMEITFKRK